MEVYQLQVIPLALVMLEVLGFELSFHASSWLQMEESQCFFGKVVEEGRLSLLCEQLFLLASLSSLALVALVSPLPQSLQT